MAEDNGQRAAMARGMKPKIDKPNIARDSTVAKQATTTTPAITPGMRRASVGEMAAYHHGITTDDLPNTVKDFTKAISLHSANPLSPEKAATHATAARDALTDAARLGRPAPPEKA